MSVSIVVIIIGAIFLGVGLIGGGIKFGVKEGEASIPSLNSPTRILAFIIGVGLIVFGIWQETITSTSPSPTTISTLDSTQSQIDAISGTWVGTAKSGDFEFDVKFIIGSSCNIGLSCGTFDLPAISCSGTITITKVNGSLFEFQAKDRTDGCNTSPDIKDSLQLLPDGTLLYISKGNDYPETRGILTKEK